MNRIKVLYIDNDEDFQALFSQMFKDRLEFTFSGNVEDSLKKLKTDKFNLIFTSHQTPDLNGIEAIRKIKDEHPDIPVFLFSSTASDNIAKEAFIAGASNYFNKEISPSYTGEVIDAIKMSLAPSRGAVADQGFSDQYKNIAELSPNGIIVENDGKIVYANQACAKILGIEEKQYMIGTHVTDHVHNKSKLEIVNILESLQGWGASVTPTRQKWLKSNGMPIEVKVSANNLKINGTSHTQFLLAPLESDDYLDHIARTLARIGKEYNENIQILTESFGAMLKSDMATYTHIVENQLESLGRWNTPEDFPVFKQAAQTICGAVIEKNENLSMKHFNRLNDTAYYKTDPVIAQQNFKSYIGYPVLQFGKIIGSFGAFFKKEIQIDENLKRAMAILANAMSMEEERNTIKEALKKSEKKYRKFAELVPVCILDMDWKGNIISLNENSEEKFGYTRNEVKQGMDIFNLFDPDDHLPLKQDLKKKLRAGLPTKGEYTAVHRSGEKFTVLASFHPIIKKNRIQFLRAMIIDISSQKIVGDASRALGQSEERIDVLFQTITEGAIVTDLGANILQLNEKAGRILGMDDVQDATGENFLEYIGEDEQKGFLLMMKEVLESRQSQINDFRVIPDKGKEIKCRIKVAVYKNKKEEPEGFIVIVDDVIGSENLRDSLKESQAIIEAVFENASESIFIKDMDLRYTRVSPAMETVFSRPIQEVLGKTDEEVFGDNVGKLLREGDMRVLRGEIVREEHTKVINNSQRVFYFNKAPLKDSLGRITGICGIAIDVTDRKLMEQELFKKNQELSEFEETLSQELKNPINLLKGYLTILKDSPDLLEENFDRMVRQVDQVISYINNLLHLSKAGKIIGKRKPVDLAILANSVFKRMKPADVEGELLTSSTAEVMGDPRSLEQVLTLLIHNSVLYRDPRKEKLIIQIEGNPQKEYMLISIKDNGTGFPEGDLEKIFSPGSSSKKTKGKGFGLPIAKKIIEAHNGKIEAKNRDDGQGAEVVIQFPLN